MADALLLNPTQLRTIPPLLSAKIQQEILARTLFSIPKNNSHEDTFVTLTEINLQ